jgi:ribosomal protein L40E
MLITCIPIILVESTSLPTAGIVLRATISFQVLVLGTGTWLVWKYGGFEEALTKVVETTRVYFPWGKDSQAQVGNNSITKYCRYCGARVPKDAASCELCHARLLR